MIGLKRVVKADLVVIDSIFPQKLPFAFRNAEINEYLSRIKNCQAYAMYPMRPDAGASFTHGYGVTKQEFLDNKAGYAKYHGNLKKIHYLDPDKRYRFKLAYTFFLAETYTLLPFLEKHHIPFVFVLYPGGTFGLNSEGSDRMLRRIFSSTCFRAAIVTQKITLDYITRYKLCPPDKIKFIYGGFVQFKKSEVMPKRRYPKAKTTFDICFVAAKYTERGVDKGYDLFIEVAKKLNAKAKDIRFHVVGGFDSSDIDVTELGSNITFYGIQQPEFLRSFYAKMDIFLSPNRPFKIFEGNFDGFPLGIDASYCGVALFVADVLKMNQYYKDDVSIVILPLSANEVTKIILSYYGDTERLYRLSRNGQEVTQKLFDMNYQINERIKLFQQLVDLHMVNQATGSRA